ncbi:MAG: ATP-binding protein [Bacteroidetes bacterium]|nr:ATP-binding protein [Bacteroidota bacterium]
MEVIAYFDELSMHAVFRNIIINAIKFTPENGKVKITINSDEEFALVVVSDTGIGIPEDVIKKVFVRNEHFISRGTNNEKGSGLGSFIIRDFVRKNNGRIEVKSKPKEGTIIRVSLPLNFLK